MSHKWRLIYWESASGQQPIYNFIEKQDKISQAKIYNTFELLIEYGTSLKVPHVKKVTGTSLWELRILGSNNLRFFYITYIRNSFLILHAIKKKTNKTPVKDIRLAVRRLAQYPKSAP